MSAGVVPTQHAPTDGLTKPERFELATRDEKLPSVVFQRLTDDDAPETLSEIAKSMGFPRGRFVEWFTTEHADRYDAALKVLGSEIGHAVKGMVDGVTAETLGLVKLKTDRYLRLAGHWNPERYSPRTEVKHSGLVPSLVIEIAVAPGDGGRVVEGAVLPAALPAPAVAAPEKAPSGAHALI